MAAREFRKVEDKIYVVTVEGFVYDYETWEILTKDEDK